MIIKEKTSNDVEILEELARKHPEMSGPIREQIAKVKAGLSEELEAARNLNRLVGREDFSILLHDLRFELPDGEVFQIDHLRITQGLRIYVFETKSAKYGLKVDTSGSCFRKFKGTYHQIPSPLAQVKNQAALLKEFLTINNVLPSTILRSLEPRFEVGVLVSPTVDLVLENDEIAQKIYRYDEVMVRLKERKIGALEVISVLSNTISQKSLYEIGAKLLALHKPNHVDWEAYFKLNKREHALTEKSAEKFGSDDEMENQKGTCECTKRSILFGRSYYFKCDDCGSNFAIKLKNGEKLRKKGKEFFLVNNEGSESLYHTNSRRTDHS